jgi:hypothetical protein
MHNQTFQPMKKLQVIKILTLFLVYAAHAQVNLQSANIDAIMMNQGASKIFRNSKGQSADIQGTPYLQKMFGLAKVENVTQKYYMRYNVYEDEFEFITPKNDTLILDKIKDFSRITFTGTNKKYVLVDYTNRGGKYTKGYLIDLYTNGSYNLFLKENISFHSGKIAKTSLEKDMPARYSKSDNTYYFKNKDNGIIEFPETKKQLTKLFPDKKDAIESFIRENKIEFDVESDRIKIINFLTTL